MSICLAGISLAPGNPTGFLRISEDSKVVRLELWRDTHSVAARTMSEPKHLEVLAVCMSVCVGCVLSSRVCWKVRNLKVRQGQALGWACNCVHARTKCTRGGLGRHLIWGTHSFNKVSLWTKTIMLHTHRQTIQRWWTPWTIRGKGSEQAEFSSFVQLWIANMDFESMK